MHDVARSGQASRGTLNAGTGWQHGISSQRRGYGAQMEVATDEEYTPIKQDVKKGALRDYPCAPARPHPCQLGSHVRAGRIL
jgi:hypothetical protein